jgi:hypothetical protein
MIWKSGLVLVGTLVLCTTSFAGVITLATSPGALGENDSVNWSQLGADQSTVSNPFFATSADGEAITGSFATTIGLLAVVGPSWPAAPLFTDGDTLIWTFDNSASNGSGPITLDFPAGFGAGAAIQPDALGAFEAKLELFHGNTSLGFVTENSDAAGDPLFIGAVDTAPEVTSAVFSLVSVGSNPNNESNNLGDFTIDTLFLQDAVSNSPEPASMLLLGGGLTAFGLMRRRSRKQD